MAKAVFVTVELVAALTVHTGSSASSLRQRHQPLTAGMHARAVFVAPDLLCLMAHQVASQPPVPIAERVTICCFCMSPPQVGYQSRVLLHRRAHAARSPCDMCSCGCRTASYGMVPCGHV